MTPDGAQAVSASFDNSLIVWDLAGGQKRAVFTGHSAAVSTAAIFPDGRRAVSGGDDGTVRLWDLATAAPLAAWSGHRGKIAAVAIAPDSTLVASAGWDGTVRLWNPATGGSRVLRGHEAPVNALAIAPDGELIASADHEGHILFWSLPQGTPDGAIDGNGFAVNALSFTPDGNLLCASSDTTVRLLAPQAKRELARYEGHDEPLVSLALSRDGTTVAAGGTRGTVMLWRVADRSFVASRYAHHGPAFALAFTPNNSRLLSGGLDGVVRQWQGSDWREVAGDVPPATQPEPSRERGAALFRKCSACHDLTADASAKAGPSLHGLFGRTAGSLPGYAYSPALQTSGLVWDAASVDRLFALGPEAVVPGSKMPLQHMPSAQDRADLIEFLERTTRTATPP